MVYLWIFFLKKIMIWYVNWLFLYNIILFVGIGSCLMVFFLYFFNFDYRVRLDKLFKLIWYVLLKSINLWIIEVMGSVELKLEKYNI